MLVSHVYVFIFLTEPSPSAISTLSLHDALPIPLVDDVRERLQGVKRLLPRVPHSPVSAVDGQRHRDHGEDVPGTAECQDREDRKSTRLNSSHVRISYAVFCLKKKTTRRTSKALS